MEFEGAELTVYSTDGEMVNLDISRMQLQAVFKVLGCVPRERAIHLLLG